MYENVGKKLTFGSNSINKQTESVLMPFSSAKTDLYLSLYMQSDLHSGELLPDGACSCHKNPHTHTKSDTHAMHQTCIHA